MKNSAFEKWSWVASLSASLVLATILLSGCGAVFRKLSPDAAQREKVDSLITFKESIAAGNYLRGVRRLIPSERDRMLDGSGRVSEEMKPRLRALRLKNLVKDPSVRLKNGKLMGIYAALPVVRQGESLVIDSTFDVEEDSSGAFQGDVENSLLRAAASLFFADIRAGNWQYALNDMHPATRSIFMDRRGRIKPGARMRLQAIDTTAWHALALRDGKLIGVVLLLPPPESGLEQASNQFFDAVEKKDWVSALALLSNREQKFLTHADGKLKTEYAALLAELDRDDWDSLLWYHERLSGVLELMGVDPVVSGP